MTSPRLEACYFPGSDRAGKWDRLARVLAYTAAQHCPDWQAHIAPLPPLVFEGDANARFGSGPAALPAP